MYSFIAPREIRASKYRFGSCGTCLEYLLYLTAFLFGWLFPVDVEWAKKAEETETKGAYKRRETKAEQKIKK